MSTVTSVREGVTWATQALSHVSGSPQLEAEMLMAFVCHVPRFHIYHPICVTDVHFAWYETLVHRRIFSEPMAYILGTKSFFGLDFCVNPSTLIPRFDTEELGELVSSYISECASVYKILDVGTGCGALLISLLAHFPDRPFEGVGVDTCGEALQLAKRNADHLLPGDRRPCIRWREDIPPLDTFDVVVCNPPYLSFEEWIHTPLDVHGYEPPSALLADTSLESWISQLCSRLRPGGRLFLEWGAIPPKISLDSLAQTYCVSWVSLIPCQPNCHFLILEKHTDGCI